MLSDDNDMLDDQRDNLRRWEVRGGGALHKLAISRALWPRGRSESYDPNECFRSPPGAQMSWTRYLPQAWVTGSCAFSNVPLPPRAG